MCKHPNFNPQGKKIGIPQMGQSCQAKRTYPPGRHPASGNVSTIRSKKDRAVSPSPNANAGTIPPDVVCISKRSYEDAARNTATNPRKFDSEIRLARRNKGIRDSQLNTEGGKRKKYPHRHPQLDKYRHQIECQGRTGKTEFLLARKKAH